MLCWQRRGGRREEVAPLLPPLSSLFLPSCCFRHPLLCLCHYLHCSILFCAFLLLHLHLCSCLSCSCLYFCTLHIPHLPLCLPIFCYASRHNVLCWAALLSHLPLLPLCWCSATACIYLVVRAILSLCILSSEENPPCGWRTILYRSLE